MARNNHRCYQTCTICGERYRCTTLAVRWISETDGRTASASHVRRMGYRGYVRSDVHKIKHVRSGEIKPTDPRARWH